MATINSTYYTNRGAVLMKEGPEIDINDNVKVVSETYYGEEVAIGERSIIKNKVWVQITTLRDNYMGWVPLKKLIERSDKYYNDTDTFVKINRCQAHIYRIKDTECGPQLTLPYRNCLKLLDQSDPRWLQVELLDGKKAYIQRGDVTFDLRPLALSDINEFIKPILGLPYQWSGRASLNGFDCSGFVQFILREMGHDVPRDSKDQYACERFKSVALEQVRLGDLVFFGPSEGAIRHVGFCLDNKTFVHSTVREGRPCLRISSLEDVEWNGSGAWKFRPAKRMKETTAM